MTNGTPKFHLDELDCRILNLIQSSFAVAHRPYAQIAETLGDAEEHEVHERIRAMLDRRIIRRIGAVFDGRKLGFQSTLVGMKVRSERLEAVAAAVSVLAGVSHNYERDAEYNLWFTLSAASRRDIDIHIAALRACPGVEEMIELPARRTFKIGVQFRLGEHVS